LAAKPATEALREDEIVMLSLSAAISDGALKQN
jgi:hypothetical protein